MSAVDANYYLELYFSAFAAPPNAMAAPRAELCLRHFSQGRAALGAVVWGGPRCGCNNSGWDENSGDSISMSCDHCCGLYYRRVGPISIIRVVLPASGLP